jgi:DNA-binding transcriptional LysR family regulator
MELHQLRYFCAVAETGSFSRAVLRELEAAKGDVRERKDSIGGPLAVGVIPTVAPYFLPPHLTFFTRQFPQVEITVVEEITPVLLERLRASRVDVALLALPIRGHEFDAFPLLTERLFAALPQKHPLANRRSISLKDLRKEPFLLLRDGHCFRDTAVAACDRARVNPQVIFESGQFSSILSMVGAGMGVSIVPEMAVEKHAHCRYVRIADDQATRTIGAVVLRGRSLTRVHQAFLAHLRTAGAEPAR